MFRAFAVFRWAAWANRLTSSDWVPIAPPTCAQLITEDGIALVTENGQDLCTG